MVEGENDNYDAPPATTAEKEFSIFLICWAKNIMSLSIQRPRNPEVVGSNPPLLANYPPVFP